jgi:hypothetical protein
VSRVNYAKVAKPETFVGQFLQYCENSETPRAYDFWTALWILSTALGRGIIVDRPGAPVYLNIYTILVAESGVTRKSTAVRRAVKFAREFCGEKNLLVESKITPERLEFDLTLQTLEHGSARATIAIDELVKFLGRERYVEALPTLLTDLYDCPELRTGGGTLIRGKSTLRNVYINFLSASTPSWLLRAINPDVIEGGFTSRVIFVVAEQPKKRAPWPSRPEADIAAAIRVSLSSISAEIEKTGISSIGISEGALKKFSAWYKSRDIKRDPFRASFQSREDSHVLRVAALLSVNDGTWEIQNHHLVAAIRIVTEAREDGAAIFEGTGSNSKIVLGVDALRDKLLVAGMNGAKQSELTKALQRYMNAEHVRAALDIMHELDMVQRFDGIQVGKGRPTTMWRAKQSLLSPKALDHIFTALEPTA